MALNSALVQDGWIRGFAIEKGRNADYRAGRCLMWGGTRHQTVGRCAGDRSIGLRGTFNAYVPRFRGCGPGWTMFAQLDAVNFHACFPAGTLVRLADGSHRSIEDVRTLDEVVTAEARTGRVLQTMVRHHSGEVVSIDLRGHRALRCTPDHPILTRRGYVAAADLKRSDHVGLPRWSPDPVDVIAPRDLVSDKTHAVSEGTIRLPDGRTVKIAPLPELVPLSPAFGRLVGLYLAEGSASTYTLQWSYGGHEEHTLAVETVDLLKSVLGIEARLAVRSNGSVVVTANGVLWSRFFRRLCPGTARHGDKHLAAPASSGSPEYLTAVLDGWLDGDGCRRSDRVVGTTVSRRLALDMHAIGQRLGLRPTLRASGPHVNRHAETRQVRWDVAMHFLKPTSNPQPQDETHTWRRVHAIDREPFDGWVYNLSVEGDESYVADGLGVHNCEWNQELTGCEVEWLPGERFTDYQIEGCGLWVAGNISVGVPAVDLRRPGAERFRVGERIGGFVDHGDLQHIACDQHTDGWEIEWPAIWAAAQRWLGGGPGVPDDSAARAVRAALRRRNEEEF